MVDADPLPGLQDESPVPGVTGQGAELEGSVGAVAELGREVLQITAASLAVPSALGCPVPHV